MLRGFSINHIDVMVKVDNEEGEWRFTGFYGAQTISHKEES